MQATDAEDTVAVPFRTSMFVSATCSAKCRVESWSGAGFRYGYEGVQHRHRRHSESLTVGTLQQTVVKIKNREYLVELLPYFISVLARA